MKKITPSVLFILILVPALVTGLEITSVYPNPASAGNPVTIIGGPFDATLRVVIGGQVMIPSLIDERQLVLVVPQLGVGEHALYLLADQEKTEQTVILGISLPPPQISSLEPSNIDECSTEEQRVISLTGDHLQVGAQLLLDGQIVPSSRGSETEIHFAVPPLKAGTYGIQVINPDGRKSLPHSLWLNNVPQIYAVDRGEDFVSSYQLIIKGKNFIHNSSLIVSEYPIGPSNLPQQQKIVPVQGVPSLRGERGPKHQSENVAYIDCNTLIYNRYPYSRQDKILILRIGNPDGKQTESYELSAP